MLLDHFLRRQDGVITYAQAREAGLSQTQVRERKASGRWIRVAPQVYFMADREFGDRARLRTAVYAAGTDAAADGLSAAWWHNLTDELPKVCTVTVPHARRPRTVPGARVPGGTCIPVTLWGSATFGSPSSRSPCWSQQCCPVVRHYSTGHSNAA